jgi:hypothetical protein
MAELTSSRFDPDDKKALWLSFAAFLVYVMYSFLSTGFYQHDEIGHYFNMRDFWNNPNAILGNSAKTGYKLIYVVPALLGNKFLVYFNAALAALTCFLTFKVARRLGSKVAWLAFFLVALQPYWIQLSFRNYADTFSGFVIIVALLFHYEKKFILSSIVLSFAGIIRQEFLLLIPLYGVWHALNKRWLCFILLGVFPLINNIWGFMVTGEPLYLLTSSAKTAARYADEWPRQGFDHYFKMGIVIWGAVQYLLLMLFFVLFLVRRAKMFNDAEYARENPAKNDSTYSALFISIPFIIYFLTHCIFNWESVKIGASTGGNLRYMVAVTPLVALLGCLALDRLRFASKKAAVWGMMVVYLLLVGVFLTYKHNNVVLLTEPGRDGAAPERDYLPLLFSIATLACLLFISKQKSLVTACTILSLLFALAAVRPFKLTPEDLTMEKITNSMIAKKYTEREIPVYVNHTLFKYFYDKKKHGVYKKQVYLDSLTLQTAPAGSIIIWESHYGYRPRLNKNAVNADYFTRRSDQYVLQQNHISTDQRFQALIFEKVK